MKDKPAFQQVSLLRTEIVSVSFPLYTFHFYNYVCSYLIALHILDLPVI